MHTRKYAPFVVAAAALMFLLVSAIGAVTKSNGTNDVATALAVATPDPTGAEEWLYLQRANADGSIPDAAVNEAIAQSKAAGEASQGSPSTDQVWAELGPSNIGGRVRDLAPDPTTKDVVYVATGSGGLWRSADGGQTLATAWDSQLPQSMGAVAVDSKGVVWAGTGEVDHGGGSAYYGKGIYKSTDDGATWTNMGLEDGDTIGQIVIDPRNDDRVFVAVMGALHDTQPTRGLFMTENGGNTWTRVLVPETASTGAIDVSINKTNPDVMLATTWDKIRDEKSRIYGPHSYVYRSTDGGHTWANVHNAPLPQSETDPALQTPDNLVGRMGVDFSDSDPNRAYLISSTARGNFNGFFTSADAGATWTEVPQTPLPNGQLQLQQISGGFAWWFGRVYVDPVNPLHVFVAGVNLAESLDGGLTWTTSNNIHVDQHGLEWDPFTPGRVFVGNDGGFYRSDENGRARGVWFKTPRLPVTQFYAMDVSVQDGRRVNAGSQDNNSLRSWASDNTVNGDWFPYVGGDGMMNRIDPTNDRKFYGCSQ
ncbi:MAG: glycosyl hydrolase repeat-containing protein, partial [Gaiellaceae bacterium]|nr:glycosyl hydrolase repeat-containing protein [Gaiellaceae bacterium]